MNRQDIANLALKITGLYCLIRCVEKLNPAIQCVWSAVRMKSMSKTIQINWPIATPLEVFLSNLIPIAILALLSYILIAHSKKLTQHIFPDSESPNPPDRILAIHALYYSLIGIIVTVNTLPDLVQNLVGLGLFTKGFAANLYNGWINLIAPSLKLVLGIALFFGSHGLVRIWSNLKYSGLRRKLGLCVKCSYDLTGNTSGICPECGTPIEQHPPTS